MIYFLAFVATALAVARLARVWIIDDIFLPQRQALIRRYGPNSKPAKLATCYWCAAVWFSLATVTYLQTVLAAAGWLPWQTLALLPITIPAVAYTGSVLLDLEEALAVWVDQHRGGA